MQQVAVNSLTRVGWIDPAGNPQLARHGVSRSAIVAIGQDNLERIFILEVFIERCPTTTLEQKILYFQNRWKLQKFGIDITGPQSLFFDTMRRRAREEGVTIHWHPEALTSNKLLGIEQTLEPISRSGRLFRPEEKYCRGLKDEWWKFPDPLFNDGMDGLANAIRLLPQSLPEHMRTMAKEQLRRYLERIGMGRDIIEERLRQHDTYTRGMM